MTSTPSRTEWTRVPKPVQNATCVKRDLRPLLPDCNVLFLILYLPALFKSKMSPGTGRFTSRVSTTCSHVNCNCRQYASMDDWRYSPTQCPGRKHLERYARPS